MKSLLRLNCVSAVAAVLLAVPLHAEDKTYTNATGGSWTTSANWAPTAAVPTASDNVLISVNGTVSIAGTSALSANLSIATTTAGNAILQINSNASLSAGLITISGNSTGGKSGNLNFGGNGSLSATGIVMSPDAGNTNLAFTSASAGAVLTLGGGTGSITTTGSGTSTLSFNANVAAFNLASVSVTNITLGTANTSGAFTINAGQTYTATTVSIANGSASGNTGTGNLTLAGGSLTATTVNLNAGVTGVLNNSVLNLNSGTLSAATIQRSFDGNSQALNWNNGTISNKTGGNLTLTKAATATQNLVVSLAGTGTHTFDAQSGKTITVASSAVLADKSGDAGTLNKAGAGTLGIQSVSTYTGATTVSAGTLLLSGTGSVNSSSGVSVAAGATFSNASATAFNKSLALAEGGVLSGTGVAGAEFTPTEMGVSGDLTDGFTTFALGTTGLTKAGSMAFTFSGIAIGTYAVFSGSAIDGSFASLSIDGTGLASLGGGDFGGTAGGYQFAFTNATNTLAVTAVPEPATWALLGAGLAGLAVFRRRRH